MRVLLDCDGVLADFVGYTLGMLNNQFKRDYKLRDIQKDSLDQVLTPAEWKYVRSAYDGMPCCRMIPWYPGAQAFLRRLSLKYSVRIVTTSFRTQGWEEQRRAWLAEVIDPRHVIFSDDKREVDGNIIVEDSWANADRWALHRRRQALLLARPWNDGRSNGMHLVRVYSYEEIESYLGYLTTRRFT
jgi:5'(3')-deoxyribonucleotidase